jgi:TolA-binding protein
LDASKELEELQSKKAKLEDESRALKAEQTNLEQRIRVLEGRVAVEMLKNNNKIAREAVLQLESKLNELEQRLKHVTQAPQAAEHSKETVTKAHEASASEPRKEAKTGRTTSQEPERQKEGAVTVTALVGSTAVQEAKEKLETRSEKKKRRFL